MIDDDILHEANRKLLELAAGLRTLPDVIDEKHGFSMCRFTHNCGSPSCAIGYGWHWGILPVFSDGVREFALTEAQWFHLFNARHRYRTPHQEAQIIEDFVNGRARL